MNPLFTLGEEFRFHDSSRFRKKAGDAKLRFYDSFVPVSMSLAAESCRESQSWNSFNPFPILNRVSAGVPTPFDSDHPARNRKMRKIHWTVRFVWCPFLGLERYTVALPVAISHKASLKPKRRASATLIQKTSKNEPKHGSKNGTAWRSHFWDRMHSLVKEQKKSTFTVPFLGPSGGTKNETAKSQNQQQRPTRATNKKWQLRLVEQQAYRVGTVALPVAISHKASLKPKRCASATLIQKTSKNEPKHGSKNGTAWRSHFWDRMHSLVKEQKKSTFTVPFLGPSGGTQKWDRKINSKGRPVQQTKNDNCV